MLRRAGYLKTAPATLEPGAGKVNDAKPRPVDTIKHTSPFFVLPTGTPTADE